MFTRAIGQNDIFLAPHPPSTLSQVLSNIQVSTLKQRFYTIRLKPHGIFSSAIFSPDGSRILTLYRDNAAILVDWDRNPLAYFKHNDDVNYAVFSPDGRRVLTASEDGTVRLWYTPEALFRWLDSANIPELSEKDKERLGLY